MIPTTILKLDVPVEPQVYFLAAEKLISGNPKPTVWMHYTDSTNQFFVGTWEVVVATTKRFVIYEKGSR